MDIGVCSVGTELLTGDQVDSNAAWLARRLAAEGATVVRTVAVGDEHDDIVDTLALLLERCDGVVVGGGLGPTPDDLTRAAVAEVAGVDLATRDDLVAAIRDRFAALGAAMTDNNLQQARLPVGASAFPPVGTAPGFRVDVDGRPVWVLPGVPWELRSMVEDHVAPDVRARTGGITRATRVVHVAGMGESAVADRLAGIEARATEAGVVVAYLATGGGIQVKVTARGADGDAAWAAAGDWVDEVCRELGTAVAGTDGAAVEQVVHDLLLSAHATVAAAESATAGLVQARLAEVPGSSATFRGGMTTYATDAKVDVLGVPADLLDDHPPVSEAVTAAMARAVRERFGATYGVATTGVAGPSPQDGVEVGTVVWAVCGPDGEVRTSTRTFPGDRTAVRTRLAAAALESLRRRLLADRD